MVVVLFTFSALSHHKNLYMQTLETYSGLQVNYFSVVLITVRLRLRAELIKKMKCIEGGTLRYFQIIQNGVKHATICVFPKHKI